MEQSIGSMSSSWPPGSKQRTIWALCRSGVETGRTLQDVWAGEPSGFLGLTVPGFPNFYMLYGPGTNGGEIVSMLMRQDEHIVRAVKRMRRQGVTALEVKGPGRRCTTHGCRQQVRSTSWAIAENYYKASHRKDRYPMAVQPRGVRAPGAGLGPVVAIWKSRRMANRWRIGKR